MTVGTSPRARHAAAERCAMGMIAPMDAAFLIQEAREHPMHVAGLQLFHQPAGTTATMSASCTGIC